MCQAETEAKRKNWSWCLFLRPCYCKYTCWTKPTVALPQQNR